MKALNGRRSRGWANSRAEKGREGGGGGRGAKRWEKGSSRLRKERLCEAGNLLRRSSYFAKAFYRRRRRRRRHRRKPKAEKTFSTEIHYFLTEHFLLPTFFSSPPSPANATAILLTRFFFYRARLLTRPFLTFFPVKADYVRLFTFTHFLSTFSRLILPPPPPPRPPSSRAPLSRLQIVAFFRPSAFFAYLSFILDDYARSKDDIRS